MSSRKLIKNIINYGEDNLSDRSNPNLFSTDWISNGWFLILAVGMGLCEAFFIVIGKWTIAAGLAILVPAVVLFTKYPFAAFILWLVATPFLQTTATDQSRTLYWILYRALPPLAVCITLLANRLRPNYTRFRHRIGIDVAVMLVFLVWTLMNIFWNHPSGNTPYVYTLYDQSFVPFCLYWWIRFSVPNEQDLKRLIPLAFFLVIFEVGIGIISWLRPEILPRVWVGILSGRTIGTLSFVHAYSLTIIFFSLLLFQAAMNQKSTITRVIVLVIVGIGVIGVFLSFSRGVWLAGLVVWVGLLYLYRKHILRLTILLLIIISIFGSTVLYKEMVYAKERLNSEQTALVRFVIWDAGMQMIKLKPIWGWGYGDYKLYAGQFQRILFSTEATKQHASHNTFISFAAELGVPGLLLYLFPAVWCLGLSLKKWRYLPQTGFWSRKLLLIFWLFLLAYCIVIFFSDIRTSTYGLSLWWVVLGWIAVMVDPFHSLNRRTTIHSPRI